jgi:transglutaminase-like putative cysteine protease
MKVSSVLLKVMAMAVWLLALPGAASAGEQWRVTAEPEWAGELPLRFDAPVMRGARDGRFYRLAEKHHHYAGDADVFYQRYAYEIINRRGLDGRTSVSVDFDPQYEQIAFHKVVIHRNGAIIDQLGDGSRVQVLEREEQLEDGLYNGELTLNLILNDVRVGDWVEYSFSTLGRNPVFEDRVFGWSSMQWGVPVGDILFRLYLPLDATVGHRTFGDAPTLRDAITPTARTLSWQSENVPGYDYQSDVPSNFHGRTLVQYSDFSDWQSVQRWAQPLFEPAQSQRDDVISATVNSIKASHTDLRDQVEAAVMFVQDEIRYTGINSGIGAWIPDAPARVLTRRYGDCKDKSVLLSVLLRELGVESSLALVNSDDGRALADYLPSPSVFDHMILTVNLDGTQYWIDPTISLQGGTLDTIYQASYHHALTPVDDQSGLQAYDTGEPSQPLKQVLETWHMADNSDSTPTRLTVKTTLLGWRAESMRDRIQSGDIDDLEDRYLDYYQSRYDGLEADGSMQVRDDRDANRVVLVEQYTIDEGWYWDEENSSGGYNRYTLELRADSIITAASLPDDERRTQPLWLPYPTHVSHQIRIVSDVDWSLPSKQRTEDNDWFYFYASEAVKEGVVELDYEYRTKTHSVSVADARRYLRKLKSIRDGSYYALQVSLPATVDVISHMASGLSNILRSLSAQESQ